MLISLPVDQIKAQKKVPKIPEMLICRLFKKCNGVFRPSNKQISIWEI